MSKFSMSRFSLLLSKLHNVFSVTNSGRLTTASWEVINKIFVRRLRNSDDYKDLLIGTFFALKIIDVPILIAQSIDQSGDKSIG